MLRVTSSIPGLYPLDASSTPYNPRYDNLKCTSLLIVSLLIAKRPHVLSDVEARWGTEAAKESNQEWPVREEEH